MKLAHTSHTEIKRVGKSGQISLGKEHAGQYFREERQGNGTIVLVPVVVVPQSHWTVRDQSKIRKALTWASQNPARPSDVAGLIAQAEKRTTRRRHGR